MSTKGKALIRSGSRRGTSSKKATPAETSDGRPREPSICDRCAAVFSRRTWRRGRPLTHERLARAVWTRCPACRQVSREEYCGRILIRGTFAAAEEQAIRERIANVAAQAERTQPQRRLVSVQPDDGGFEVLTTSQKLAHRIVHELKKAFGGRAAYNWSDDGSLLALWHRNRAAAAAHVR